jgi:hypothetical protein
MTRMKGVYMVKQFLTLCFVQLLLLPSFTAAQGDFGAMDIPQPESVQSGIGMLSGWKCEENGLTVRFDGGPEIAVAYGSSREDTRVPCLILIHKTEPVVWEQGTSPFKVVGSAIFLGKGVPGGHRQSLFVLSYRSLYS